MKNSAYPARRETKVKSPEFSVVINAHNEGHLLKHTLSSVDAALNELDKAQVSAELIVILDNGDDSTQKLLRDWGNSKDFGYFFQVQEVSFGDLGLARNEGAIRARGQLLAFVDGDDLVSSNYFIEGYLQLRASSSTKRIFHPGKLITFGSDPSVWNVVDQLSGTRTYVDLLEQNLWPSASMSFRSTYLETPYWALSPKDGFGPEDWFWNVQTIIKGYTHSPIVSTTFFYRKKFGGLNAQHSTSLLPAFDIKKLAENMPENYSGQSEIQPLSRDLKNVLRKVSSALYPYTQWLLPPAIKRAMFNIIKKTHDLIFPIAEITSLPKDELTESQLLAASQIEPAISIAALEYEKLPIWDPKGSEYGRLLNDYFWSVTEKEKALIFVPWLGVGGADLVALNYLRAFMEDKEFSSNVSIIATFKPEKTDLELIPTNANLLQFGETFSQLPLAQQSKLIGQLVVLLEPKIILSINCFHFSRSLQLFSKQMCSNAAVYLSLFAFDKVGLGYPLNPITDDPERSFIQNIAGFITDNSVMREKIKDFFSIDGSKVILQLQPGFQKTPNFRKDTASYNDLHFTEQKPFKILWPHRIDSEKKPELLSDIALAAKNSGIPISIDVFGQSVLTSHSDTMFKQWKASGINYKGPYKGGLQSLPVDEYHALLLTSESEGTPNVVIQSMLMSLPVISTSVGGVPSLLDEGRAGLLISHYSKTSEFVDAISKLVHSRDLRRRIIENAYLRAFELHSWKAFWEDSFEKLKASAKNQVH